MEGRTTFSRMTMRMERAMEWTLENHNSSPNIRTTLLHCLKIHYLERAAVLIPQIKIMKVPSKAMKHKVQARRGFKEKKNGFLTL